MQREMDVIRTKLRSIIRGQARGLVFSPARRRSARFICYWSISLSVMVESYQLNYLWLAFQKTSTTWSHPPHSSRPVSEAPPKSDYEDDCPPRSGQLSPDSSFEAYEHENSVALLPALVSLCPCIPISGHPCLAYTAAAWLHSQDPRRFISPYGV